MSSPFPLNHIEIETIRACNARCVMCPISNSKESFRYMKDELFDLIVEDVRTLPKKPFVYLFGLGEPLMDKNLEKRAKALRDVGVPEIDISTNCSLLTRERAISLIEAGITMFELSVDTLHKETFEEIRIKLSMDEVRNNVVGFMDLVRERNYPVQVNILGIVSAKTSPFVHEYLEFLRPLLRPVFDKITVLPAHNFGQNFSSLQAGTNRCSQALFSVHILADGTYSLCCCDSEKVYNFGNVKNDRIMDVHNSAKVNELRILHMEGKRSQLPMCATCSIPESHANLVSAGVNGAGQFIFSPIDGGNLPVVQIGENAGTAMAWRLPAPRI